MNDSSEALRQKVAIAMRILAMQGCVMDIMGHVSARIPGTNEMFIRCRGGNERGLIYTDIQQIRRVNFSVKSGTQLDGFMVPLEVPIHGEIYKARPEVQSIVHAHPYACLICGITELQLRPIFGSYDPSILAIAVPGVPVYPRSVLINRPELASDLIQCMGTRDCCLMKGHGITTLSSSVEAAALLALRLEKLAKVTVDVSRLGGAPDISQQDLDFFSSAIEKGLSGVLPDGDRWIWVHLTALLRDHVGIPEDFENP